MYFKSLKLYIFQENLFGYISGNESDELEWESDDDNEQIISPSPKKSTKSKPKTKKSVESLQVPAVAGSSSQIMPENANSAEVPSVPYNEYEDDIDTSDEEVCILDFDSISY